MNWGSTFPLANGAASTSIITFLLKKKKPKVRKPFTLSDINEGIRGQGKHKYRPQILNVYDFSKVNNSAKRHPRQVVQQWRRSIIFKILVSISLVGFSVFLAILGAFGTAVIALLCAISKGVAQSITLKKPIGYLKTVKHTMPACLWQHTRMLWNGISSLAIEELSIRS